MGVDEAALMEALTLWPQLAEYASLSEYEAKIYLCLLGLGARARRVSALTGIPRTKIYGALRRLMEMGLIGEVPGTPTIFLPTSPGEAFGALLGAARRRVEEFSSLMMMLRGIYEFSSDASGPWRGEFWLIRAGEEVSARCRELLRRSRYSVLLAGGLALALLFNHTNKELDELYDKKCGGRDTLPSPSPYESPRQGALLPLRGEEGAPRCATSLPHL